MFGGQSAEHNISLQSAQNIIKAINKKKYNLTLIKITKQGKWLLISNKQISISKNNLKKYHQVTFIPGGKGRIFNLSQGKIIKKIDVVFPILHGPFGEDGTVQGLLKLAVAPFIGADVLGSAVGMDKDVMKRLLRDACIPIGKFLTIRKNDNIPSYNFITKNIGMPCFVKPARLGSSIGINKVINKDELYSAIKKAFQYDDKILIEEFIDGREIECAILESNKLIASVPGEIITKHSFYSYKAKYTDKNGTKLIIPAKVSKRVAKNIQSLSIKIFQILSCRSLARIDFFLTKDNKIFVNEINTMPSFTKNSMYPKLLKASGISYTNLIDKLIQNALKHSK